MVHPEGATHCLVGTGGAVATSNPMATRVAREVLEGGGTAVDAALAASFMLGVVEPFHSGIGGSGFLLLYLAQEKRTVAIDARGVAPAAATAEMYVQDGSVRWEDTVIGHRSVLVPGLLAGLGSAHRLGGILPLDQLVEPAAAAAEGGFAVSAIMAHLCDNPITLEAVGRNPQASKIYMPEGRPPRTGEILRNPDLAASYRKIGREGVRSLYEGELAAAIADDMVANGGLITRADLAAYAARIVEPLVGSYRGYELATMPPPSSGGVFLLHCLKVLEGYDLGSMGRFSVEALHLLSEVMKLAFADRAHYIGDPRFVEVPLQGLVSEDYAVERRQLVSLEAASSRANRGNPSDFGHPARESGQTTHICVADGSGNVASITQTIGSNLASGVVPPGTGIVLNHMMSDFSPAVGASTTLGWGTYTSVANAIAPGKTPASSQTPVIGFKEGQFAFSAGAAGGSRIPSTVLQVVLNLVDFGMDVQEAISALRLHDQGEGMEVENGVPEETVSRLRSMGHQVAVSSGYKGAMSSWAQGVARGKGGLLGAGADPRADGSAAVV